MRNNRIDEYIYQKKKKEKDEPTIVLMRKSHWTSQHRIQHVKTHDRTIKRSKMRSNTDDNKNQRKTRGVRLG